MAEFDPEAFLKKGEDKSFDPEKFLSKENPPSSDEPGALTRFAGGVAQGAIFDPVTGIDQLIEHATNNKIRLPDSVKEWLENYKNKYASGTAGAIGQGIGTVGSFFVPGGAIAKGAGAVGRGVGLLSKAPAAAKTANTFGKIAKGVGYGAAGGAVQPVDEDKGDFGKQKASQAILGGLGGGLLGSQGGGAGLSALAIQQSAEHFGWPATLVGLSFLTPTLHGLATHHQGWKAAHFLSDKANLLVQRPGASYAAGRVAGNVGAEPGAALMGSMTNDQ